MTQAVGTGLALLLLAVLAALLWWTWRRPFVGLGVLVAGMAFHNFLVMVLLRLGTPYILIRAFQGWKEILLIWLTLIALRRIWQARRERNLGSMLGTDWVAAAFAVIAVIYFLLPSSLLHSDANLSQRLVGLRIILLIPLLYFLGRTVTAGDDRERLAVVWLSLGAAAAVTIFGLYELFFVPTRAWLDWGVNAYSSFLGFTYHGPSGMPENFFLSLPDGTLVRRMVSTYISPLGLAYTAVLLFPMAVAVIDRRVPQRTARWIAVLTILLILGVALSITRLALFSLIGEAALMWLLLRRAWIAGLVPALILAAAVALFPYTSIAPAVDRNLTPVHRSGLVWAISGNDSSGSEHYAYLISDIKVDLQHPFGLGTGASTIRYGKLVGTGESAVLGMFGDLGLVGGALYVALYLLTIWHGWRALRLTRKASLEDVMPLIALVGGLGLLPITMTSDLWGDLSVTFLFWWAAGATATLSTRAARAGGREAWNTSPAATVS
jgi:hypothetical protein